MLSILTLKPVQIAQELTRYQAEMLQAISPLELQKGAWTSKKKVRVSESFDFFVKQFQSSFSSLRDCCCQTRISK